MATHVPTPDAISDLNWQIVGSGDFNSDGHPDIVWQNVVDGRITAWLMNGLALTQSVPIGAGSVADVNWRARTVGDLNNDGRPDVLWQHQTEGWVAVWLLNGTTLISGTLLDPEPVYDLDWRIVGTGHANPDGKTDVLWHHQSQGRLAVWGMNGLTRLHSTLLTPDSLADTNWKVRATADLNRDGSVDLLWQNTAEGTVAAWYLNGLTRTSGHYLNPSETPGQDWNLKAVLHRSSLVATPTISLPAGTYTAIQTVTASCATAGATIRYTVDGTEPTESSPVMGTLQVTQSTTLRVKAFKAGLLPSWTAAATYTLQATAPTIAPGSGTYSTAQTVTLSTATPDATIRYTLDGSDPQAGSPEYSQPISIDASTTITARTFRAGWTTSPASLATLTFAYGILSTPVASPAPGSYSSPQTVTLTGEPGATIRYTVDGSMPTESSPVYAAPIPVADGTTTLRAVAFKSDWTPSSILVATYTVATDTTPPTLRMTVTPAPNAAGWNNTDVVVRLDCQDPGGSGVQSCPEDIALTAEGAGQLVTVTITDHAGNAVTQSVTVHIDKTPPLLTVADPMPEETDARGNG